MTTLAAVHLLDDFALGGVTKGMTIFDDPALTARMTSRCLAVQPDGTLAPHLGADLIFTHFPPRWRSLPYLASLRLRNPGARLIHVEHSYSRAWESAKIKAPRRFRAMLRLGMALFDRIVAVSSAQGRWLGEVAPVASRLSVIHPWSGSQRLDDVPLATNPSGRPIMLGAYGRFAEQKGFDTLIDAMRLLDPARFSLIIGGFGPDDPALRARAEGAANIRFWGKVEDVGQYLSMCDVIVVPSRWEPFGQVAAEAKLAGRAVLVADVDGLPEQMVQRGLVADCSTPEALADAIRRLPLEALPQLAQAGRESMRDAETQRVAAWLRLIDQLA